MSNSPVTNIVSQWLAGNPLTTDGPNSTDPDTVVRSDASEESTALEDYGDTARDSESTSEDLLPGSDSNPADQKELKAEQKSASDKETITVSDDKGKRKVEIDYSDRAAIKKAYELAHGSRKWQADRDKAIASQKETQSKLEQLQGDWSALEQAYKKGPEHLFDLLQGRQGAFQEHIKKQLEREEFIRHASPDEVRALEAQERAEARERELAQIREENENFKKQVQTEREVAEERALESRIHPAFQKYRFAETLGNADDEHMFDSMLWKTALERLEPYEEKGVPITPELVDREFRNVATSIRKRIGVQAEKKAAKVVEQKKREATENVQAKVMSGYKTGGAADEARNLINKGDLTSLLKGWGKYGGLFNKK